LSPADGSADGSAHQMTSRLAARDRLPAGIGSPLGVEAHQHGSYTDQRGARRDALV